VSRKERLDLRPDGWADWTYEQRRTWRLGQQRLRWEAIALRPHHSRTSPIVDDEKPTQSGLNEIQELLNRFASGGNQSEQYAHKVADRITQLFPEDNELRSVAAVLANYKNRVGKAEAEQTCRKMIHVIDFRLYGERFAWDGVPEEHRRAWEAVFSIDNGPLSADLPDPCPICESRTLHRYYRVYRGGPEQIQGRAYQGSGGGWTWCSSCLSYEHGSAHVPAAWPGDPLLDTVERLEHSPEFLERALRKAESTS
jgi:hypothetical protein